LIGDAVNHFQDYGYSALIYLDIPDANIKVPNYSVADWKFLSSELGLLNTSPQLLAKVSQPSKKTTTQLEHRRIAKQSECQTKTTTDVVGQYFRELKTSNVTCNDLRSNATTSNSYEVHQNVRQAVQHQKRVKNSVNIKPHTDICKALPTQKSTTDSIIELFEPKQVC
jgi:hypothetical protein